MKSIIEEAINRSEKENQAKRNPQTDEELEKLLMGLKTNIVVARHMAILAMTGGGKTVASRRIIRELLESNYPLVILDPHGDYLGFWEKEDLFPDNTIKLFYPHLNVNDRNRDI